MIPPAWRLLRCEPWPSNSFSLPPLQAHRGYWSGGRQENTVAAFRAARSLGFQMCELDVILSRDGIPVVFHDADLRRLAGRDEASMELTAKELRLWARAPSLKEVLLDSSATEFFNIELKSPLAATGLLEKAVAKVVEETAAERRVMFSSFNPFSLVFLTMYLPDVPRALLASEEPEAGNRWLLRRMAFAPLLKIHLLHLDQRSLDEDRLRYLREKQIPFAVWTVDDELAAQRFLAAGAKSVIVDRVRPVAN